MSSLFKFSPSFGTKLTLWYAGLLILCTALLFLLAYHLIANSLFNREARSQQLLLEEIQLWHAQGGLRAVQTRLQSDPQASPKPGFLRIDDGSRQSLFILNAELPGSLEAREIDALSLQPGVQLPSLYHSLGPRSWIILSVRDPAGTLFQMGCHPSQTHDLLHQFRRTFLLASLPTLALACFCGAFFSNRALRPLHKLSATARTIIEQGDLSARVPSRPGHDDISTLVTQFNRMLDTNERLIRTMHDALDNVAHDLRTPITRLRGSAETALQRSKPTRPEEAREALADCLEEAEKIQHILDLLMDLAEARSGVMQLQREPLQLADLVRDVTELYALVAEEAQMTFQTEIPESLRIIGDSSRLRQALANLVDNAIKYGSSGQTIHIKAWSEDHHAVLEISDSGQGIAGTDLPRIWERLYRGDKSRNKRGLGLGLSLVQAIIHAHEGKVSVRSELGRGSSFRIELPL
ncbi:MAG: HAMP domain-containing protein [Blastochloris sp.]|nr:HAMP domain-containing protein [Blastochloris sp.]